MTIYRVRPGVVKHRGYYGPETTVCVRQGATRYYLEPGRVYDDADLADAELIRDLGDRYFITQADYDGLVEQATAAPGEKRSVSKGKQ